MFSWRADRERSNECRYELPAILGLVVHIGHRFAITPNAMRYGDVKFVIGIVVVTCQMRSPESRGEYGIKLRVLGRLGIRGKSYIEE